MPRIVTAIELPEEAIALIASVGDLAGPGDWLSALEEAEAIVTPVTARVDAAVLARAPRLRIVANAGVGYDNIDLQACARRDIVVTNTPGVLTDATADLAIALMLCTVRRVTRAEESLRAGEFRGWGFWDYLGGDIRGAVVGIFGMGRIGQAFARRARVFGPRLQYTSRSRLAASLEKELDVEWVQWDTLIETSDILSLHASYSPAVRHIINGDTLGRMKPGGYIINTSRGAIIDEAALVEALRSGQLAGVGLDVYEREPEVHAGLLECPGAVLLPHIGSATRATRTAMAVLACRNVGALLSGLPALTPVATDPAARV